MKGKVWFVSGIDTSVGKTVATGLLAKALMVAGKRVITQKMIQTGCVEVSEDIEAHRQIQGIGFTEEDKAGLTCPYIFTYPCSPHMAAAKDGREIDLSVITQATERLSECYEYVLLEGYEYVLLEGAGGLMVPTVGMGLTIDYVKEQGYPMILVTSGKLGSLNHTLLSVYACQQYGIPVQAIVYNRYPSIDPLIEANSLEYLRERYPEIPIILLPEYKEGSEALPDIAPLL